MTFRNRIALAMGVAGAAFALSGCETVAETLGTELSANMTGSQEAPGPGDPDGSGQLEMEVDAATPQICYDLDVIGIEPATQAHVHRGARGASGPPIIHFEPPADGESGGCVSVSRQLAAELLARPGDYYVNVHNARYPDGAIRGQLANR